MDDINVQLLRHIKSNNASEVIKCLENGADINHNDGDPLMFAIMSKNYELTKLLIDNDADVDVHDGILLMIACERPDCEIKIIELLLQRGISYGYDIDALEFCILNDNVDALKLLLQYDAVKMIPDDIFLYNDEHGYVSIYKKCILVKAVNVLEFIINNYPEIIPDNTFIKDKDIKKYNFIKMLINKNIIDIAD